MKKKIMLGSITEFFMHSFVSFSNMFTIRKCKNVFINGILEAQALTLYFKVERSKIDVLHSCKMLKISRAEMN